MKLKKAVRQLGAILLVSVFITTFVRETNAQTPSTKVVAASAQSGDKQGELQLAAARTNPLQLRQFLKKMPKGADLHYHLSGGVYAESFIRAAVEDGLCVDTKKLAFTKCAASDGDKTIVPTSDAYKNQSLYDQLINAFSMRSFVPYAGVSGHDHFFDTFAKFGGTSPSHKAEWVDEAASRAAAQNEQYLELMETPDFSTAAKAATEVGWKDDLKELREALLAHNLKENVKEATEHLNAIEKKRREKERCDETNAAEACKVDVRFIYQILRGLPKEIVFAQTLLGFEAASADPERIVGINFVMPEDGYISMRDYALQMRMVKYLHEVYPNVHITLHAGELGYGMVPPDGLCCHIRLAVEAGAERIGHGVDVMFEDRPHQLLKEMAAKHVMTEINLSSNDVILGVSGKNHPLPMYQMFDVPVALSTDDEGVSRIDLTNEYVRAAETYNLKYVDLKKMVRTGLEHAFLPGQSLWEKQDVFTRANKECAKDSLGNSKPSRSCDEFLKKNEKAQQQWELERRFHKFEADF
ncbi:MAG TPA: adenosine deaminase [Candidatus Dormibacteraeota bacterium]|nr:adenosine deaminase [Candidatus Dormibacteraeota bacterium]